MADFDTIQLIDTLKKVLKRNNLTYKNISEHLGLSEVSVKRIFSKYDCSLSRLAMICSLANISIIELGELSKKENQNLNYFLTQKQETLFTKELYLFHFFTRIYRGEELEVVLLEMGLTKATGFKYLRQLEKIELLELLPHDTYKFLITGRLRLNLDGPLFKKVIKSHNIQFLNKVYDEIKREDCCFQSSEIKLTKKSLKLMVHDINELGRKYSEISYQEERLSSEKDLVDVSWLFAFLPYKTDWSQYKPC
ncbi:helix-turn-helix domain-containing protein [Halobacteriovorax sp. HLS]|uniref:helix-turn-helix domain-containing protein n=1 Tax=Halobacteriovorax sp. HLS TaxID=2234000 RepID=UPI000FDC42B1|nr:helix-turn-helix domain-containing protein [Halobacteriovorax sp. HLS]